MVIKRMPSSKSWENPEIPSGYNLLYQLPTGGGKTVIFSELAKRYILETGKRVLILTHRIELLGQTSTMLSDIGVPNKIINSKVKELEESEDHWCYVAMVETLNNRLNDERIGFEDLGLIVVDEAHYNSFRKLFKHFDKQVLLGVTATPCRATSSCPCTTTTSSSLWAKALAAWWSKVPCQSQHVQLRCQFEGLESGHQWRLHRQFFRAIVREFPHAGKAPLRV